MKTKIFITLVFLISIPLYSQWTTTYDGGDADHANAIAVDVNRNVYVTGWSNNTGSDAPTKQIVTIKYNSSGTQQWVAAYDDPDGPDEGVKIVVSDSGNVYVTGKSYLNGTNSYDYITIKYNSSGTEQWVSFYNGSGSRNDYSYGIAVNGSGDVFVTGWADGNSGFLFPDPEWEFVTIKYNAAGVQQWVQIYDYVGSLDRGFAIALDDSSNVYVTGSSYDSGDPVTAATTIKYNSSGTLKWSQRYDGPGSKIYDGCVCIVLDDSANVYVGGLTGPAADGPNLDYLTIKYSRGGAQRWFATYDGPGNSYDVISEIAVDDAHNVYVTGRSRNDDNDPPSFYDEDFATIKYNITGSQQWVSRYNSATNRPDVATGIKLTCQGVYVAGWSSNGTNLDYKWIRYASSDGGQDWVRSYNSGGQDSCTALCVVSVAGAGAIDHIYLTGAASYDYVTKDDTANNSCLDSPFGYPLSVDNRNTFTWSYSLSQNYPNPFNPQTEIFFEIKFSSPVKLTVYDITGKEVLNMINNEYREAGRYSVKLDGTNLASGMYFYRIEAGSFTDSKKMLLIK